MKPRLRKLWLTIHRWLGLTAGLLFVWLGLTGSILVFDHAIDEWLNPDLLLTDGGEQQLSLSEIVAAAEQAWADGTVRATAASRPRVPNGVWTVWFQAGPEDAPRFAEVYVNAGTGQVTGDRVWGEYPMTIIYRLHYTLLAGETGGTIVGVAGLILMVSVCSGIYLWWPLWRNGWRSAFVIRGGERFNYDLHKTIGIASSLLLLVIAFTGVYMTFPEWIKPIVTAFSEETVAPLDLKSPAAPEAGSITPEQAVAIASSLFPEATFCHFHPPQGPDGTYEVAFRQTGESTSSFGQTQVWLDRYSGEVLLVRNSREFTAADTFFAWQFPLHNGEAFGLVGRWIVFFAGLTPAALYATGFLLWRRRRAARRRQATVAGHHLRSDDAGIPQRPVADPERLVGAGQHPAGAVAAPPKQSA